jgi:hypothetical protein
MRLCCFELSHQDTAKSFPLKFLADCTLLGTNAFLNCFRAFHGYGLRRFNAQLSLTNIWVSYGPPQLLCGTPLRTLDVLRKECDIWPQILNKERRAVYRDIEASFYTADCYFRASKERTSKQRTTCARAVETYRSRYELNSFDHREVLWNSKTTAPTPASTDRLPATPDLGVTGRRL